MHVVVEFLIFIMMVAGFVLGTIFPIIGLFNSALGNITPKDSIILTITSGILGSILMLGSLGLKLLLQ